MTRLFLLVGFVFSVSAVHAQSEGTDDVDLVLKAGKTLNVEIDGSRTTIMCEKKSGDKCRVRLASGGSTNGIYQILSAEGTRLAQVSSLGSYSAIEQMEKAYQRLQGLGICK
jgi:hypothetical protein